MMKSKLQAPQKPVTFGSARLIQLVKQCTVSRTDITHEIVENLVGDEAMFVWPGAGRHNYEGLEDSSALWIDPQKLAAWATARGLNMISIDPTYDGDINITGYAAKLESPGEADERFAAEHAAEEKYREDLAFYNAARDLERREAASQKAAQKAAGREKYNDPEYIEFLRQQAKMAEKYGKDGV